MKMDPDSDFEQIGALRQSLIRAIRLSQEEVLHGARTSNFVPIASDLDGRLYAAKTIPDPHLRTLWEFADAYFFSAGNGVSDVDGIEIEEAARVLETTLEELEATGKISNPVVLRYGHW